MSQLTSPQSAADIDQMHAIYRGQGAQRAMAPHVVYSDSKCPHDNCSRHLQAIDFRLEAFGRAVHDPLVKAWWDDTGFAGRCPGCGGWIHFTIRGKRAIDDATAQSLPRLPVNWADEALIL